MSFSDSTAFYEKLCIAVKRRQGTLQETLTPTVNYRLWLTAVRCFGPLTTRGCTTHWIGRQSLNERFQMKIIIFLKRTANRCSECASHIAPDDPRLPLFLQVFLSESFSLSLASFASFLSPKMVFIMFAFVASLIWWKLCSRHTEIWATNFAIHFLGSIFFSEVLACCSGDKLEPLP